MLNLVVGPWQIVIKKTGKQCPFLTLLALKLANLVEILTSFPSQTEQSNLLPLFLSNYSFWESCLRVPEIAASMPFKSQIKGRMVSDKQPCFQ